MAKLSVDTKGFDLVLEGLNRAADVDSWGPKALNEAAPILEEKLKSRIAKHDGTGAMSASIKKTKPKKNKWGHYIVIRPTGIDIRQNKGKPWAKNATNEVRNMEKLVYMEYGTSTQSPTPVMTPALNDAENAVTAKLQEVFEREVMK